MNGQRGLDGLVEVVINPGMAPTTTYEYVLLDNEDPNNVVGHHTQGPGNWRAHGYINVPKMYIVGGQLIVRVNRHEDDPGVNSPWPPVGSQQPIDMSTTPPTVPTGVYEYDDAFTVHIFVWTQEGSGGHTVTDEAGYGYVSVTADTQVVGACCHRTAGVCIDNVLLEDCSGEWFKGEVCDYLDPACEKEIVPTVSEWGLVILSVLLLTGIGLKLRRPETVP